MNERVRQTLHQTAKTEGEHKKIEQKHLHEKLVEELELAEHQEKEGSTAMAVYLFDGLYAKFPDRNEEGEVISGAEPEVLSRINALREALKEKETKFED